MLVIGIDAAVSARNVGVAVAQWDGTSCVVRETFAGSGSGRICEGLVDRVLPWLREEDGLIAVDAPLGWPQPLAAIATAPAGASVSCDALDRNPFLRATDRIVRSETGKQPLAVAADRIARTAAASLAFLGRLRERSGRALPLAWAPFATGWGVIEVYPAATRPVRSVALRPPERAAAALRAFVQDELAIDDPERHLAGANRHVLDACVCVVAAKDFLRGAARAPAAEDEELARREGWIWFRAPRR